MEKQTSIKKLIAENYKNLQLDQGFLFRDLNIFIGPNGSGKSNMLGVLKFLKSCLTDPSDEITGQTSFDHAVFELGGSRILDGVRKSPAQVNFKFQFEPNNDVMPSSPVLELQLLIQGENKKVILNEEALYAHLDAAKEEPFYFYRCHNYASGQGAVSVFDNPNLQGRTHFEKLSDVPVNELALFIIPRLLENSGAPPENTPVYKMRRQLMDAISQWRFYNANDMNLKMICSSEPKIGQGDRFLSLSGENLPLVLHNLMQDSLDFEENINNAMKAILPATRKIRAVSPGRLSLTVEWHLEDIKGPFYLNEMSDGTVRMLCWATILHSPVLPNLLVIDEPELGIHVAWMSILAEWIKKAASKTQLIISTHSPDLLDYLTDYVENVAVFCVSDSDKSHFEIKPLLKENVAKWLDEGWQLGDLYRIGDPSVGGWPW